MKSGFVVCAAEFYMEEGFLHWEKIQNKETWEIRLASFCRDNRGTSHLLRVYFLSSYIWFASVHLLSALYV